MAPRTVVALTSLGFAQKKDDARRETVLKAVSSRVKKVGDLGEGVHEIEVLEDASADPHAAGIFSFLRRAAMVSLELAPAVAAYPADHKVISKTDPASTLDPRLTVRAPEV
ncbi:hypothetical protein TRAPUB_3867 [Trametes pubescens]|uniref:Uncharacterized protein n=1 Tax=Trametes pubescens TaxID=154538 RepID=A0A1M2VCJ9_TRAPU|nr:hypothetical protein TRAPUB_3867 [Trametes pubescens]